MASGSRSRGNGSRTGAPSANNALIAPQLKPEFDACEHKLAEAKAQIHQAAKTDMGLQGEIRAPELKAANAKVSARHDSSISRHRLSQRAGVIKEEYGEEVGCEDVLGARAIAGHKVPKEEAQGEDVEASHHIGSSQGEQPARATKKARKEKVPCFYNMVLNALKEKQELLQQKWNEEAIAKEAAATASKPPCKCWWSDAPTSKSAAVKEDSNDGLNDS